MDFNLQFLDQENLNNIVEVFNRSFEGYFVPINYNTEQLELKIRQESIDLSTSVGAYDDNTLVGFILIGLHPETHTFYNAGTGVLQSHRGYGLTRKMYYKLIPKVKALGYNTGLLEVVKGNAPAIQSYQSLGYKITRALECYTSEKLIVNQKDSPYSIQHTDDWQLNLWNSFDDWIPTWQNSNTAVQNIKERLNALHVLDKGKSIAYAIYDKVKGRIHQMAVSAEYRQAGIGKCLIKVMQENMVKCISWINIDADDQPTNNFMKNLGCDIILTQYEMKITL